MSRPYTFVPPSGARAYRLETARGSFAVVDMPAATDRPRGTALLLPGFTGSKEDFVALHEPLAEAGYRTVAVDGRGQHESPGPADDEAPYERDELARDVLAQVAALGTRVHLMGHSLGGVIARAALLIDSSPFLSFTVMSSGPGPISQSQQDRYKILRDALAVMTMEEVWNAMRLLEPPEETATEEPGRSRLLRRRWLNTSPAQLVATGRQLCAEPDRVAELKEAGLPVHVVSGERDDTWAVPLLDDMARRLGAERTVIAGAEHSPNTDRPAETAAAFAAFWDRHG